MLLVSAAMGMLAGGAWGAGIQALATPSVPSISVIGTKSSQIALLDTTGIRALILLGPLEPDLQVQIPALMTMLRQRIDLLIGQAAALHALGSRFRRRWQTAHTLAIPNAGDTSGGNLGHTYVMRDMHVDLGAGITLELAVTTRDGWNSTAPLQHLWTATLAQGQQRILFAPDAASAQALGAASASLLILPDIRPDPITSLPSPAAVATNARDDLSGPAYTGLPLVMIRTYPTDIARFEMRGDGLTLPDWVKKP